MPQKPILLVQHDLLEYLPPTSKVVAGELVKNEPYILKIMHEVFGLVNLVIFTFITTIHHLSPMLCYMMIKTFHSQAGLLTVI